METSFTYPYTTKEALAYINRQRAWSKGYPNTAITEKQLLDHWQSKGYEGTTAADYDKRIGRELMNIACTEFCWTDKYQQP